jgi:IS30 family transposase
MTGQYGKIFRPRHCARLLPIVEHGGEATKGADKSLTWDRGKELTDHRRFTLATKIDVYFCDPQIPWPRGSNENTNEAVLAEGTDLSVRSQAHLNTAAHQLNETIP